MRCIDADKLYPDCMTKKGTLAISQSQIANAPTVLTIPDNPTNGDMIKAIFPADRITELNDCIMVIGSEYQYQHHYPKDWWNAPYKKEAENE